MRVAVLIVRAAADDGVLRLRLVQQAVARGGAAAVVAGLDDVAADVLARVKHVRLALVLGVAGEEEGVAAVVHAQDEALVIDVAVVLLRAEDGHGRAAEGERVAHVRHGDGEVCRFGRAHDALERAVAARGDGAVERAHREGRDDGLHAAAVVGVRVRADEVVDGRHAVLLEVGRDLVGLVALGRVDEHDLPVALQQRTVALADVEIRHGQPVAGHGRRGDAGRSRGARVGGCVVAAVAEPRGEDRDDERRE